MHVAIVRLLLKMALIAEALCSINLGEADDLELCVACAVIGGSWKERGV